MNENEQSVAPATTKKSNSSTALKIAGLFLNVAIVAALFIIEKLSHGAIPNLKEAIAATKGGGIFILCACLMWPAMILTDSVCYTTLIYKAGGGFRPFLAIRTTILGKYYDFITPMSTGGQPFQCYYLTKNGIPIEHATSIPFAKHTVRRFTVNTVVLFLFVFINNDAALGIKLAAVFGVAFNLALPIFLLITAFRPKLGTAISTFVIKLAHKLKIVKDYDKTVGKVNEVTQNFLVSMKRLSSSKTVIGFVSVNSLLEVFCCMSVPYLVARAFGVTIDFWDSLVKGLYTSYASSYIPTPGSSGGQEAFFYALFGDFFSGGALFWAVVLWRSITYYFFLLAGFVMNCIEICSSIVRARKAGETVKFKEVVTDAIKAQEKALKDSVSNTAVNEAAVDSAPLDGNNAFSESRVAPAETETVVEDSYNFIVENNQTVADNYNDDNTPYADTTEVFTDTVTKPLDKE